jgi:hypothetical protein
MWLTSSGWLMLLCVYMQTAAELEPEELLSEQDWDPNDTQVNLCYGTSAPTSTVCLDC